MRLRVGGVLLLAVAAFLTFTHCRPIPAVAAAAEVPASTTVPGTPPVLPWPKTGSAAVGNSSLGVIATSGVETPLPAASVAKVMTALLILEDKPLKLNDPGPTSLITDANVRPHQSTQAQRQAP